ncbi:MAG: aminoacyl-tRNA deacylase [Candidatus Woesearchaeota archaeon]
MLSTRIPYKEIEIPKVHTAKETADALGVKLESILKSMLIFDEKNPQNICVVVLPGNKNLDFDKISEILQYKKPRFYPKHKIYDVTGFEIGTLPPFGYNAPIAAVYDKAILLQDIVYAGSGKTNTVIAFNPKDLDSDTLYAF